MNLLKGNIGLGILVFLIVFKYVGLWVIYLLLLIVVWFFLIEKNLCIIDLYDLFYINLRGRIVKSYMNKIFIIFYVIFIEKFIIIK